MTLIACSAGGQTWGLAWADLGDPGRVGPALKELRAAAMANLQADSIEARPLRVAGATPHAESQRVALSGRRPDGETAVGQLALFTRGTVIYQATALGRSVPAEAAEVFFSSLRSGP
jgi:hypothetical protein